MTNGISSPEEVRRRLQEHVARRGYLLPQQGMMAVAMPDLQDAYTVMYSALTLQQNHFTPYEREVAWMGILIAAGESIGTHHVKLFIDCGGTPKEAEAIMGLVAMAMGASRSYEFMHRHWQQYFAPLDAVASYRENALKLTAGTNITPEMTRLTLLAVHTTFGHKWGIEQELLAAYEMGLHEGKIAESISLPFWAAGVNRMIDACEIWLHLIHSKRIQVSEPFQVWAETAGQGAMPI